MADLIWSSTNTTDYLFGLGLEELKEVLINDFGYDEDMISNLDKEGLEDVIYDDVDRFDELDIEDFEQSIKPELEKQTSYGVVIKIHNKDGEVENIEDLATINYDGSVALMSDGGNLSLVEYSHATPTGLFYDLYACPNINDLDAFIQTCMDDAIQDKLALYEDDPDYGTQEAIDDIALDMEDDIQGMLENYCDFSKVPEVCAPLKDTGIHINNESLEESATSNNVSQLEMDLAELEADYEDFGPEGFYAVPFNKFYNDYPEFTDSVIITFLDEMVDFDLLSEDMDEVEEAWADGELITEQDWPVLFDGAKTMLRRDSHSLQWKDIYKKFYKTFD